MVQPMRPKHAADLLFHEMLDCFERRNDVEGGVRAMQRARVADNDTEGVCLIRTARVVDRFRCPLRRGCGAPVGQRARFSYPSRFAPPSTPLSRPLSRASKYRGKCATSV